MRGWRKREETLGKRREDDKVLYEANQKPSITNERLTSDRSSDGPFFSSFCGFEMRNTGLVPTSAGHKTSNS